MDLMTLVARLVLDKSAFDSGVADATAKGSAASQEFSAWGVAMGNLVATGITRGIRAAMQFAKSVVATGMDFEAEMSAVKAVGQLTEEEFAAVRQKAIDLGGTTKFTASEVAEGLYYMGLAGWDAQEMLDGIAGVLDLAAASGEDLGTVSDIVTDAITAFGLEAQDVSHFVDVLAAASANSNTTISQMGTAFRYLAPIAGTLGYSIDDVATALGLIANNGIKSSQAGTSLRQILSTLVKPSEEAESAMNNLGLSLFESDGKVKSLMQIMQEMRAVMQNSGFDLAGNDLEEYNKKLQQLDTELESGRIEQEEYNRRVEELTVNSLNQPFLAALTSIGGLRGISTLMALMNSTDEDFAQLSGAIENSAGAAAEMAQTMLDNLKGDVTLFKSASDTFAINAYDKNKGWMREGVQMGTGFLEMLNAWMKDGELSIGELRQRAGIDIAQLLFGSNSDVDKKALLKELSDLMTIIDAVSTEAWAAEFDMDTDEAAQDINELMETLKAITGKDYTIRIGVDYSQLPGWQGPEKPDYSQLPGWQGPPAPGHASGLWTVPYDDYLARLHRGERVLSASQARHGDGGSDALGIAAAVRNAVLELVGSMKIELNQKTVGKVVGDTVSKRVHKNIDIANSQTAYSHGR